MKRYTFGPFLLDPQSRVLLQEGEPVQITAKALDTLLVLVENRGRLLDKDELLSRVWTGGVVEEASLTQAIFTIRKALGDNPKDHYYIATVAGRGYQFVAPVSESAPAISDPSNKNISRPRLWDAHGVQLFVATFGLLLIVAGVLFWRMRTVPQHSRFQQRPRPITSLPGVETMPAFAPDGRRLAYVHSVRDPLALHFLGRQVAQANIYVKLLEAGTEIRVTNHTGADYFPAWSPNGDYIAFYRDDREAAGYYVVSALGGSERRITDQRGSSAGIAWFPGGGELAVSQVSEGSHASPLLGISVETGRKRQLTFPLAGTLGDAWPAFSPDGKTLAFARIRNSGMFDLCLLQVPEAGAARCSSVNGSLPAGLVWNRTGDSLIGASMIDTAPRLWRYDLKTTELTMLTSGEQVAEYPAVSRDGRLAYVISQRRAAIYQFDLNPPGHNSQQTKRITYSSTVDADPALSPDAGKVAFVSVRSGSPEIWVTAINSQASTQLTRFSGLIVGSPSWSPNGEYIAFDAAQNAGSQIYVMAADGGEARQITAQPGGNAVPSWSRDGSYVYFSSDRTGDFQIWKCRVDAGETSSSPATQVTRLGGFRPFESKDGGYLYYAKGRGKSGLWRRGLLGNSGVEEPVLESLQEWGWWALGPEHVYFLELPDAVTPGAGTPQVQLRALNVATRQIAVLAKLSFPVLTASSALAISQDGEHLAYSQIDSLEADIMLLQSLP